MRKKWVHPHPLLCPTFISWLGSFWRLCHSFVWTCQIKLTLPFLLLMFLAAFLLFVLNQCRLYFPSPVFSQKSTEGVTAAGKFLPCYLFNISFWSDLGQGKVVASNHRWSPTEATSRSGMSNLGNLKTCGLQFPEFLREHGWLGNSGVEVPTSSSCQG